MQYSVWNTATRRFDYYQTSEVGPTHAPPASHVSSSNALGATPDEAAWPLPPGARMIGSGSVAKGRVAKRKSLMSMGDTPSGSRTVLIVGGLLAAAVLARRYLR